MTGSIYVDIIRLREWLDNYEQYKWKEIAERLENNTPTYKVQIDCTDVNPHDLSPQQQYHLFYLPQQQNWGHYEYNQTFTNSNDQMADFICNLVEGKIVITNPDELTEKISQPNYPTKTEAPDQPLSGTLLNQRYRIERYIGHGAFGQAYLAIDEQMPEDYYCVVKRLKPSTSEQGTISKAREFFNQEAKTLQRLRHDCIPRLLAYFEENNEFYLVQEYIEGEPVNNIIPGQEKWQEQDIKTLLKNILTPLKYLHEQNIIHRDIKPYNLILRESDNKIVLIDFGAVKAITQANFNKDQAATIIGTPGYMPHEQTSGNVQKSSDLYAVAMIAKQAVTGRNVHDIHKMENWETHAPQLSKELKAYINRLGDTNYRNRPNSATEALEELEKLKGQIQPPPPPDSLKKLIPVTLGLLGFGVLFLGIKSIDYFRKPKISVDSITIGTVWKAEAYVELENYLEENLVPANYLDYLRGKKLTVIIDGDRNLAYDEARKRIAKNEWDIAFATSPVTSVFAIDNGYSYLGGMFPDSPYYEAGLFVRSDSPIKSIDDITPETKIALGSFTSASSFIIPAYLLYGKTVTVDLEGGRAAISKVKEGKVDVGAGSIGDSLRKDDPELRIIYVSRQIPSSGVYLSSKLSPGDRQSLKQVMLDAPEEIQEEANYGNVPQPDYTEFRKIIARVDEILVCSDFSKNPVQFFCPENTQIFTVTGRVNGVSTSGDNYVLKLQGTDKNIYSITINRDLWETVTGLTDLLDIQGKNLAISTIASPVSTEKGFSLEITKPKELRVLE